MDAPLVTHGETTPHQLENTNTSTMSPSHSAVRTDSADYQRAEVLRQVYIEYKKWTVRHKISELPQLNAFVQETTSVLEVDAAHTHTSWYLLHHLQLGMTARLVVNDTSTINILPTVHYLSMERGVEFSSPSVLTPVQVASTYSAACERGRLLVLARRLAVQLELRSHVTLEGAVATIHTAIDLLYIHCTGADEDDQQAVQRMVAHHHMVKNTIIVDCSARMAMLQETSGELDKTLNNITPSLTTQYYAALTQRILSFTTTYPTWTISHTSPAHIVLTRTHYSSIPMPIFVAGHGGMLGSALVQVFQERQLPILTATRQQLDLLDAAAVDRYLATHRPRTVIMAATRIGSNPVYHLAYDILSVNVAMQQHVIQSALRYGVERLVLISSVNVYTATIPTPMAEMHVFAGQDAFLLNPYALGKLVGLKLFDSCIRQYRKQWWSAVILPNMYGPSTHFTTDSYAIPTIMRTLHNAKLQGRSHVEIPGTQTHVREFMHVRDAATGILEVLCSTQLQHLQRAQFAAITAVSSTWPACTQYSIVNLSHAELCVTIERVALLLKAIVGYAGTIGWGALEVTHAIPSHRVMNTELLRQVVSEQDWRPTTSLCTGLTNLYKWYVTEAGVAFEAQPPSKQVDCEKDANND